MVKRPAGRIPEKTIITGVVFAVLALCGCRTAPGGPYRTFAPEGRGFTFEIPADWKMKKPWRKGVILNMRSPDEVETIPAHIIMGQVYKPFDFDTKRTIDETRAALSAAPSSTYAVTTAELKERLEWLKKEARGDSEISFEPLEVINISGFTGFKYSITSVSGVIYHCYASAMQNQERMKTGEEPDGTDPRPVQEKSTSIYLNMPDGQLEISYSAPVAVYEMKTPAQADYTRKTRNDMYEKHLPELEHLLKTFRWTKKSQPAK